MKIDKTELKKILIDFQDWHNEDEEKTPITEGEIDLFIKEKSN